MAKSSVSKADERTPLLDQSEGELVIRRNGRSWRRVVIGISAVVVAIAVVVGVIHLSQVVPVSQRGLVPHQMHYDVILVGAGPAGSVLARLLSESPRRQVLLVEAGNATQRDLGGMDALEADGNQEGLTPFDVPYYWTQVANTRRWHWQYPDVNVAKALGGCGIHNAMLYVRALPFDLEKWSMKQWTWDKALEVYKRMEDFDGPNSSFHGHGGPVRTSPPSWIDPISQAFVNACTLSNIPYTSDFNAPDGRFGAGFYHFNTRHGVRDSAARAFLGPILSSRPEQRQNLHLLLNTEVLSVELDDTMSAATGILIRDSNGNNQTISLKKNGQVVLTAGAINSPKLLMQSGIGHQDELNRLGIPTRKHLPRVGMNLQDHPVLGVTFANKVPQGADLSASMNAFFQARSQLKNESGSFGVMGSAGISAGAFLIPPGSTIPEIQLTFFPQKSEPHISNSRELNHATEILITVALLTPEARNRVVLSQNNHDTIARVVPEVPEQRTEHLSERDVRVLAWGVQIVRDIAASSALSQYVGEELAPGKSVSEGPELFDWVESAVFRNSHWVGSAAMGQSARSGVVDGALRVFGIDALRVADASVIPVIPNGNVHSTVLMVASHAAEMIEKEEASGAAVTGIRGTLV